MARLKIASVFLALMLLVAGCSGPGGSGPANETDGALNDTTTSDAGFGEDTSADDDADTTDGAMNESTEDGLNETTEDGLNESTDGGLNETSDEDTDATT